MHGLTGDPPSRAGSFMPPATTRRFAERSASREDARIVPPFVPSEVAPKRESTPSESEPAAALGAEPEMAQPEPAQPEPTQPEPAWAAAEQDAEARAPELVEVPPAEAAAEAVESRAARPEATTAEAEPIELSWESLIVEEEIVVEPTFAADTDAVLNQLSDYAAELSQREEFPVDAFGAPESMELLAAEPDSQPGADAVLSPVSSLAERLEKLSHILRVEQSEEIVRRLAAGDRLDTLLAGLLAGYLAGRSEQ
jgi:hypothetical protein